VLVVTEVAPGQSLAEVMRDRGRLPVERAVPVVVALARTLEALHAAGLAHGDLRPSRVRVDGDDVALVTHGLARPDEDEPEATLLASPAYLSPARTSGAPVTPADDVWSLGVLLYALVEGTPPFAGHSVEELRHAIAEQDAARATSAPAPVADAIAAMLDKDPARRPSMAQVRELLDPARETVADSPAADSPAEPAEPAVGFAPTQTPGPPVKPPAEKPAADTPSTTPVAPTARPAPAARTPDVTPARTSRRATSTGPDWHTIIPLVGIVVLLLISWYLLSKF